MSVAGCDVLQRLLWLEQRGFQFTPDAAMFSVAALDQQILIEHLRKLLTLAIEPPSDYREICELIFRKARVHGKMPAEMIERRLQPYVAEARQWAFRRFVTECTRRRIRPIVIYRPAPVDFQGVESVGRSEIIRLAGATGLEVIDLSDAFDAVSNRESLIVVKWEHHTTALGHRLLADKLYERLFKLLQSVPRTISVGDNQAQRK
jgi:hypothetical protein